MAIHAKINGLLIGGKVVDQTECRWIFQAMDNKRPTVINKFDKKNQVFEGDSAVEEAMHWINKARKEAGLK